MAVAPGGEAATTLTVRNDSDIVEAYGFEVVGPCAPWTTVEPGRLSLYPGTSETVTVRLHPPRSPEVRAGEMPLAVRVLPVERPDLVAVPETTVFIEPFAEVEAALVPQRRRSWWSARFRTELRNRGNTSVTLSPVATDPAEELRFRITPDRLELAPGAESEVRLRARTRKLIWFGKPVGKPFLVTVTPETPQTPETSLAAEEEPAQPRELPGEFVQLSVLPKWLLALLALLLVLLLAWFTLVRPAVQSAAKEAAGQKAEEMVQSGELEPGPAATGAGQQPGAGRPGQQPGGVGAGDGRPGAGTADGNGQQSSGTIDVRTGGGARTTGTYVVPDGKMFLVTDLVLANFQGDEGVLTVSFGERVITTIALETFRNQDYHWVTPIEIPAGAAVAADVTCAKPGTPASGQQAAGCVEVLNVSGELRDAPR